MVLSAPPVTSLGRPLGFAARLLLSLSARMPRTNDSRAHCDPDANDDGRVDLALRLGCCRPSTRQNAAAATGAMATSAAATAAVCPSCCRGVPCERVVLLVRGEVLHGQRGVFLGHDGRARAVDRGAPQQGQEEAW